MTETLRIEDDGAVRTLVFARPEAANAFNEELYHAAARALRDAASDDGVSVVLLTGEGRAFTAGTDIKEMAEIARDHAAGRSDQEMGSGFVALVDALAEFTKPLIAAVNGSGVGLGITMLGHCDVVLIAEHARLMAPFASMGVVPEAAGSYLLPARMGHQQAALALFTGNWVTAEEAVRCGLALRACPAETLLDTARGIAGEIAAKPLASLVATKELIVASRREEVRRAREREDAAFARLLGDAAAGDRIASRLG
ncbi:enoyl-CoA hydratase/isomerase family protein [Actinomadura violacea]|uniref:Enoyl-CoA hydratase/isomerase family protein n=1 Tax=Actinomadura violacea TaxID=2819934 RepID=A0ABS3RNS7_9ACTN|nr:enoyl-CoA hydratase/isomerase family protein [Actinomadura violacea]MBO2457705.1 enoyl-CoA hydratase/isomerase family protein [Actinomadura violacea]